MPVVDYPHFTDCYESVEDFTPRAGSLYLCGRSVEHRSAHLDHWRGNAPQWDVDLVEVVEDDRSRARIRLRNADERVVRLRSSGDIDAFWSAVRRPTVYVDITGLRHHVWAPLLRGALSSSVHVIAIYVEPGDYRPSIAPTENQIYDLSESIEGIGPLPGFARLREYGDQTCFVPLLGFEGTRVSYLISQLEPLGGKIVPIVGVPGFRAEYPFITYLGNRAPLLQSQAWKMVRYASANCPFDLFYVLESVHRQFSGHLLKIAPIGTKPHALGGVMYAIANPSSVELVYDHPIRKAERTEGTARLLAYHVSDLLG